MGVDGELRLGDHTQLAEATIEQCYLASDATDSLTIIDKENPDPTSNEVTVGSFGPGVADIEAIAVDPVTRRLYGADAGQLGIIDFDTGAFTPLPQPVGTGGGPLGELPFDDVDGLTFHPINGALFASVRRPAPQTDLLIRLNKATGAHRPNAFGAGVDYREIPRVQGNADIDDLAVDLDGTMYAISNNGGQDDRLITINPVNGNVVDIGPTIINDVEGLGFDTSGQLWGSSGAGGQLYRIDKTTGVANNAVPIDNGNDYEGIDCLIDEDPDGDGIPTLGETIIGTDPFDADSDDDCILDGDEPEFESDSDGDGMINPLDPDSDNDGILDGTEVGTTGPAHPDTDLGVGACVFDADPTTTTDPLDPDSDDGGELDGEEDANQDGAVDSGETDPNQTEDDFTDPPADSDNDGVPDAEDNCPNDANPDQGDDDGDGVGDVCDQGGAPGITVTGGGCAVADRDGGWLLALLVLAFALRRRSRRPFCRRPARAGLILAVCAFATPARAQTDGQFTLERFRISGDRDGVLDLEWGTTLGHLRWDLGLWLGTADDPLVVKLVMDDDTERIGRLISQRNGGQLVATIGFRSWLQAGFELPLILSQGQDLGMAPVGVGDVGATGLGDLRVVPKLHVLRSARYFVDVAVIPAVTLPTSTSDEFFGEGGVTFAPELAVSRAFGPIRVVTNLGYRLRGQRRFEDLVVDDEVFWRVGAGYRFRDVGGPPLGLDFSITTATRASSFLQTANNNHVELLGGVQYTFPEELLGFAAVGVGLNEGFGTPDWRVLIGVRFGGSIDRRREPLVAEPACDRAADPDCDTVPGAGDRCPGVPGLPAHSGCPAPRADVTPCEAIRVTPAVAFASDTEFTSAARLGLDELARVLTVEQPNALVVVDSATSDPALARARADAVTAYLRERGVAGDRLSAAGPDSTVRVSDIGAGVAFRLACPDKEPPLCKGDKLAISGKINFGRDSDVIDAPSLDWLKSDVVWRLRAHPEAEVTVEGHTSSTGTREHNIDLSKRRAAAVRQYLIERGVNGRRLASAGYGPDRPIADNRTEQGRAANRRIEFAVTESEPSCPKPPPPACVKLEVGKIHFRVNTSIIVRRSSRRELRKVRKTLRANPEMRVQIAGHTSSEGKYGRNKVLSGERAEAVKAYLVKRGIAADRLVTIGYGPDRLAVAPENTEADREENRRVEFTVISQGACAAQ